MKTCGQPSDQCSAQCSSLTEGQLTCLEGAGCEAGDVKKCLEGGTSGTDAGSSGSGKFGDPCKCKPDTASGGGEFECSGTNICTSGLSCVGTRIQGIDQGTCRGPACCSGQADCATKLGKQSNCTSDQQCRCTFGDLECVGANCTCASGVAGSRGLCYPK